MATKSVLVTELHEGDIIVPSKLKDKESAQLTLTADPTKRKDGSVVLEVETAAGDEKKLALKPEQAATSRFIVLGRVGDDEEEDDEDEDMFGSLDDDEEEDDEDSGDDDEAILNDTLKTFAAAFAASNGAPIALAALKKTVGNTDSKADFETLLVELGCNIVNGKVNLPKGVSGKKTANAIFEAWRALFVEVGEEDEEEDDEEEEDEETIEEEEDEEDDEEEEDDDEEEDDESGDAGAEIDLVSAKKNLASIRRSLTALGKNVEELAQTLGM